MKDLFFLLMLILVSLCWFMAGRERGIDAMKKEAVKQGHAEHVSGSDGSPVWRWKDLETPC